MLIGSLIAGILLGIFYFAGLWFTVQKALGRQLAGLFFIGSFLLRTAVVLVGFYFVAAGSWERMVICAIGFITARFMVIHYTKKYSKNKR